MFAEPKKTKQIAWKHDTCKKISLHFENRMFAEVHKLKKKRLQGKIFRPFRCSILFCIIYFKVNFTEIQILLFLKELSVL